MLIETNLTVKEKYCTISPICGIETNEQTKSQTHGSKEAPGGTKRWEVGEIGDVRQRGQSCNYTG